MAKASPARLNALTEYGEKTGLAFQVIDDILDVTGTKEELGKSAGADHARGKNTYPSIFGLNASHKIADELISDSINALKIFNKKAEPLEEIAKYIISRRN
jgi:geranylgeranyl diphosphate synthase type II